MLETTIAGKYRMRRLLGEGGMGAVYEAEHTTTGRRLAVKLITLNDPRKKAETIARFEREARMAGSLDTEHIVQVIDSGEDPGLGMPFMVMEMLQGEDLEALVRRAAPLSPDLALRIAAQACVGLRQAHRAGIIHRDIKPANLFLAQRDEGKVTVKILDFGVAKAPVDDSLGGGAGKLTRTGAVLGSPYYMSPEQALGEKDIDARSDLWSLGVVLYAMLTGRTPHEDCESLGQIILRICSTPAAPVQDLAPWVPPEVAALVHRALLLDRGKRFATASEMLEALRALLPGGEDVTRAMLGPLPAEQRAHRASRLSISDQLGATQPGPALARSAPSSSGGRRSTSDTMSASTTGGDARAPAPGSKRPVLVLGGAAVLAALALVGYRVTRPDTPSPPVTAADSASALPAPTAPVPAIVPAPSGAVAPTRTVELAVPPGAIVEIGGEGAAVKGGKVALTGALGSVHRVRVAASGQVVEREVVIAETGPVPERIDLAPRPSSAAPAVAVKPPITASPAAPPAPAPVARPVKPRPASTVDKNFDQ